MTEDLRARVVNCIARKQEGDTAALVLYRFKVLCSKGLIESKYQIHKWHILMILSYVVTTKKMPSIQNKKIEDYCRPIIENCSKNDNESCDMFKKAIEILNRIGIRESRDEIRSVAYTQQILRCCNNE